MGIRFQAPRGTRDLLPGEIERWQWAEARARGVLERYGYREIRTPHFEEYELLRDLVRSDASGNPPSIDDLRSSS